MSIINSTWRMVWRWKADGRSETLEGLEIEIRVEGRRKACGENVISSGEPRQSQMWVFVCHLEGRYETGKAGGKTGDPIGSRGLRVRAASMDKLRSLGY